MILVRPLARAVAAPGIDIRRVQGWGIKKHYKQHGGYLYHVGAFSWRYFFLSVQMSFSDVQKKWDI